MLAEQGVGDSRIYRIVSVSDAETHSALSATTCGKSKALADFQERRDKKWGRVGSLCGSAGAKGGLGKVRDWKVNGEHL